MDQVLEYREKFYVDLYMDNDQILDTDFENYLTFYGCHEYFDELNEEGQTKDSVEQIIMDAKLNGEPIPELNR